MNKFLLSKQEWEVYEISYPFCVLRKIDIPKFLLLLYYYI